MFTHLKHLKHSIGLKSLILAAAVAAVPSAAFAGHDRDDDHDRGRGNDRREWRGDDDHRGGWERGDRYDRDRHDSPRGSVGISINRGTYCPPPPPVCAPAPVVVAPASCPPQVCVEERVWVPPVYRTAVDRRWVEPVYRTVCDKVWVEPVVQRVCDRVWVPDRYEWREVVTYDAYSFKHVERKWCLVEPGHYADGPAHDVIVTPGHYEDRPRQELVCAGHWETVERQELVCAGHWETRGVAPTAVVVAPPPPRSEARIDVRFPVRW